MHQLASSIIYCRVSKKPYQAEILNDVLVLVTTTEDLKSCELCEHINSSKQIMRQVVATGRLKLVVTTKVSPGTAICLRRGSRPFTLLRIDLTSGSPFKQQTGSKSSDAGPHNSSRLPSKVPHAFCKRADTHKGTTRSDGECVAFLQYPNKTLKLGRNAASLLSTSCPDSREARPHRLFKKSLRALEGPNEQHRVFQ